MFHEVVLKLLKENISLSMQTIAKHYDLYTDWLRHVGGFFLCKNDLNNTTNIQLRSFSLSMTLRWSPHKVNKRHQDCLRKLMNEHISLQNTGSHTLSAFLTFEYGRLWSVETIRKMGTLVNQLLSGNFSLKDILKAVPRWTHIYR